MKNRHGISKLKLLRFIISIMILISFLSCEKKIKCDKCDGKGIVWSYYDYNKCAFCKGSGQTTQSKQHSNSTQIVNKAKTTERIP
jgi:DnaJ-class molecular chaperone